MAFAAKTTADLTESGNLYFTNARADARFNMLFSPAFTGAFNSVFTGSFNSAFATKTTDNLTEGTTNLYFTNTRARQSLSVG